MFREIRAESAPRWREEGGEMVKEEIQAKDRSQEQRERWIQLRANFPSVWTNVSSVLFAWFLVVDFQLKRFGS